MLAILIILTFGSFAVVQGIKLQQLTLVVSALLAGCAAALAPGNFALAGFLLALATIKPQLALPVAGWLVLWAVSDWRSAAAVFSGVSVLTIGDSSRRLRICSAGMDGTISRRRRRLSPVHRRRRFAAGCAGHATLGKVLAAIAVIAVAAMGWRFRRAAHDSAAFSTMLALVLAVTLVIVPSFAPYNQVLLLPAVFLIAASWKNLVEAKPPHACRLRPRPCW